MTADEYAKERGFLRARPKGTYKGMPAYAAETEAGANVGYTAEILDIMGWA